MSFNTCNIKYSKTIMSRIIIIINYFIFKNIQNKTQNLMITIKKLKVAVIDKNIKKKKI